MDRAYSLLEVKSFDNVRRIFRGIATTPHVDRVGDIVDPLGAQFEAEIPLLWAHDQTKPIGVVKLSNPTASGIEFEAEIYDIPEAGTVKDRLDEAWHSVKHKLARAVSIGFSPIKFEPLASGGRRFLKYAINELSVVTIPANANATISLVKSIDNEILAAASGNIEDEDISAGVSATKNNNKKGNSMKTFAELRSELETKHLNNKTANDELLTKSLEEGRTFTNEEKSLFDGRVADNKEIADHIARIDASEAESVSKALPIAGNTAAEATATRNRQAIVVKGDNLPKGTRFARYAACMAASNGNRFEALQVAKQFKDTPEVETVLKAAVDAGTTTNPEWAGNLVEYQTMQNEFIELLRPETILGNLNGFRRVPFNIRMIGQTAGSSVNWVGEGQAKPVSPLAFDAKQLGFAKLAGIVVVTDELAKFSNPAVTNIITQDMVETVARFLDDAFLNPAHAGSQISPASVTNGVTPIAASGTSADNLKADIQRVFAQFLAQHQSVAGSYWIMSAQQALAVSMLQNPLGNAEFPSITMTGGTLFGLPVIVSHGVV
ncbi:phage major capsid protein [Aureimonas altamirensis]|uniref:phage major capsid protein n=1 Tax=Aureimonas altamirensis TaxID=370622 RepID=UPI002037224A|nr:phage major capsid protein [Aureimonas altamirensis]MCM2503905.1 phage major capsid protein [Aureimonas altamirensis]